MNSRISATTRTRLEKILGPLFAIALLSLLLAGCKTDQSATPVSPTPTPVENTGENQPDTNAPVSESEYEDGTYTATGNYTSPAGQEEVEVSLTLADGIITAAEFEGKSQNATSQKLQGRFSEGFETAVVGKPLDELSLTVVNGSSLTPKGFMDAVTKIKAEAQA